MEVDLLPVEPRRILRAGRGEDSRAANWRWRGKGGAEHTLIDFIGEIKDEYGTTVQNVRDKVDIKLSDATAAELAKRPIEYDTGFTLLPGKVHDQVPGARRRNGPDRNLPDHFVIPNLNKEEKRIPISSVVLSSQRVDLQGRDLQRAQG